MRVKKNKSAFTKGLLVVSRRISEGGWFSDRSTSSVIRKRTELYGALFLAGPVVPQMRNYGPKTTSTQKLLARLVLVGKALVLP